MRKVVISALLLAASAPAMAQTAWGIWNNGTAGQTIVNFAVNTPGVFNTVGPTGIAATSFINSLDFGATGSNLYLATNDATNFLYDVSMITGAASNPRGSGLSGTDRMGDLSYDHFNGRMLGVGTPGVAGGGGRLYQIDLATGAATNLGTINGFTEGFTVSLAVRPSDGMIFAHGVETDRWYQIDPNTLNATPLGLLGWNTNFGQGASFDPASGTLYHAMLTIDGGNQNRLATIDTVTGLPTFIGTLGGPSLTQIGDIAFQIPAPGAFALLGGASVLLLRRRR